MVDIFINRVGDEIEVKIYRGAKAATLRYFLTQEAAEDFAIENMGKRRGMILSTLDMTPEQLAEHHAREARIAALRNKVGG